MDCARRELLEEAGIIARDYEMILEGLQLSNSVSNEKAFIFLARGLSFVEAEPEDTEQIIAKRVPVAEAIRMAADGEIRDAMSVAGLLKLAWMLGD